jgi:ABC-type spermidine/putrescine transport system permease subunit II
MKPSRAARIIAWVACGLVVAFLFAPVVLVVVFSFNAGTSANPPFKGLSLRWYRQVWSDELLRDALHNSAIVAIGTVAFSMVVGTAAAFAVNARYGRLTHAIRLTIMTPLILPGLFLGVALLSFVTRVGIGTSLFTVFVGHALVAVPIVFLVISARLTGLDKTVVEAARDLGASAPQAFMKVTLPALAPALVGAAFLVAAFSIDEFIITLYTNGGDITVPVLIYSRLRRGIDPSINAIATVFVVVTTAAAAVAGRLLAAED